LSAVSVYHVDSGGQLSDSIGAPMEQIAQSAIASGSAQVSTDESVIPSDSSSAIAIPVHRGGRVVSVVVLSSKRLSDESDELVGVFEVWEPVGIYNELALKHGYFGKMERFRNVSSYVRFEKGTGLPGQVWQQRAGVIHDDLSNHPGFLRSAGASADLLATAVGIPIATTAFHAAALLISSTVSPIACGFEVWHLRESSFSMTGGAYRGVGEGIELPLDARLPLAAGLPGLASQAGGAVLSEDVDTIFAGRNHDAHLPPTACGLAIPFFEGDTLTSVTTFLF
jgi:putative methionine-R-sulfoxide reductase with GAF domain